MVGPLALVVVVMASLQQGPAGGMIRGEVRSHGSRIPLPYARVELVSQPGVTPVQTDSTGAYQLRNIPAGWHLMRVTHIDHATFQEEVLIADGKEVLLDFDLDMRPVKLPPVTAQTISFYIARDTIAAGSAGLAPASARVLESSPGVAELGLADMVKEIPGHQPPDPSDVLYV
ncbi:MAG: carboxypeptidase-like regulatory domain-containing protein, partial [Longimicrobiales bacterium]